MLIMLPAASMQDRDAVQRRLASTEAEFRCALQVSVSIEHHSDALGQAAGA